MLTQAVEEPARSRAPADRFRPEEVEQFEREGYVIARGLAGERLREEMLAVTREHLARQVGPVEYEADLQYPGAPPSLDSVGGRTVRRLKQAHSRSFAFTEWLASAELGGRMRQLLGPGVAVPLAHHNCIMTKEPRHSSDTGWHQDIRYWSFQRPELVSAWLALGAEQEANGCLRLIPGTHQMALDGGRLDASLFLRPDLPENRALIERQVRAELAPGDVLFFHARTFHAASRNFSDEPKFSVVFTFRPSDNRPLPGSRSAALPELLLPASEE